MSDVRIRRRGKTYSYNFDIGRGPDGKRKQKEKGGFKTRQEALDAGMEAYTSWKHGDVGIISEKILITDFLKIWLERKKRSVKETSIEQYESFIEKYSGDFAGLTVQEYTPGMADAWINKCYNAGLSHSRLKWLRGIMSNVFKTAIHPAGLIMLNPFNVIEMPANAPRNIVQREIFTQERIDEIMSHFPWRHRMHIVLQIAIHTGMREGEICGLTWDRIDLKAGTIMVDRQLIRKKGGCKFGPPKSDAGIRSIPIDKQLISLLKKWRKEQLARQLELGPAAVANFLDDDGWLRKCSKDIAPADIKPLDFICTDLRNCGRFSVYGVLAQCRKYKFNMHSFRHTHVTQCIEGGASIKSVAARAGHSDLRCTEKYTHATEMLQQEALDAFVHRAVYK